MTVDPNEVTTTFWLIPGRVRVAVRLPVETAEAVGRQLALDALRPPPHAHVATVSIGGSVIPVIPQINQGERQIGLQLLAEVYDVRARQRLAENPRAGMSSPEFEVFVRETAKPYLDRLVSLLATWNSSKSRRDVRVGSEMGQDNSRFPDARSYISHSGLRCLQSGADQAITVCSLVVDGHWPAISNFSLLRGAIEALAHGVWLLQPEERATRLERQFSLLIRDIRDEWAERVLGQAPNPEGRDREIQRIQTAANYADVRTKLEYPGSKAVVRIAAEATPTSENILSLWMMFSAYAHARPWARDRLSDVNRFNPASRGTEHTASDVQLFSGLQAVVDLADRLVWLYDERAGKHA